MDCKILCCSQHGSSLTDDNILDISVGLTHLNKNLLSEKQEKKNEILKLEALISLAEVKLQEASAEKIYCDPLKLISGAPLTEYLAELVLPNDLYSIFTSENLSLAFMVQINFIPPATVCYRCYSDMPISYFPSSGYIYYCYNCHLRNKVKNETCFQCSPLKLDKILLFIFLWVIGIRNQEISTILGANFGYISNVTRKLRQIVGEEFKKDLPKFSGIVEIEEFDFIKRKIEIGKSKTKSKWILVMAERKTKQVYIEHIPERSKQAILPIIQRMCMPGTIIITRMWSGYGRLEDLGFCHYKFDKKLGFTDPTNKHIHHCNAKNAFTWLKYRIKSKNRGVYFLQEYILEWLWKKKNFTVVKGNSNNMLQFKAILSLLKDIPRIH